MDNFGEDLEYRDDRIDSKQHHQPVKKNIPLKLKSSQPHPVVKLNTSKTNNTNQQQPPQQQQQPSLNQLDFNENSKQVNNYVSQSFTDLNTDFSTRRSHPIEKMNWNLNMNNISQKINDQPMDVCMICSLPILIYGRLIPCKHVMCIQCANSIELKMCLKDACNENIERIDKAYKGGIFVCNYDLDYMNNSSNIEKFRLHPDLSHKRLCGRSYMSQRDLNSHIQHRHDSSNPIN